MTMQSFGRRAVLALALVIGALGATSVAGAQTDPPPVDPVPETPAESTPASPAVAEPTTVPPEPTAPQTTTTLAPCEKTADLSVVFIGRPVVRVETIVTFEVDTVISGEIPTKTTNVNFPLDDRFIFDKKPYRVAASFDAESKVFVSKVRPPRNTAVHCLAKDKIYTVHGDGSAIDTGVFSGMSGYWKRVPLTLLYPLGGAVGALLALVILKHSSWWVVRRLARLFARRPADA
jgi:hypothetical protein